MSIRSHHRPDILRVPRIGTIRSLILKAHLSLFSQTLQLASLPGYTYSARTAAHYEDRVRHATPVFTPLRSVPLRAGAITQLHVTNMHASRLITCYFKIDKANRVYVQWLPITAADEADVASASANTRDARVTVAVRNN
jgi:hypothetical protein